MRRDWFVLGVCLVIVAACSNKPKELSADKMKVLIWDLARAEAFHTYYLSRDTAINLDLVADTIYGKVFALHKVDISIFSNTIDIYRKDPVRFKLLMDSVNAYGNRMRDQGNEVVSDTTGKNIADTIKPANE